MRTKHFEHGPNGEARINYCPDWEEWQVRLFQNGRQVREATYHTDDKADAYETARAMVS